MNKGHLNVTRTNLDSETQSRRRLSQIKKEEELADALRKEGWEIFSPTVVCDRVGIKDGKVFFIEFKKAGQDLREGQEKVRSVSADNYRIIYY